MGQAIASAQRFSAALLGPQLRYAKKTIGHHSRCNLPKLVLILTRKEQRATSDERRATAKVYFPNEVLLQITETTPTQRLQAESECLRNYLEN